MTYATLDGTRIVSGSVSIPWWGAWVADVVLSETATFGDGVATLVIGYLTLIGTIVRAASFAGSKSARVVGGRGGWRKNLLSHAYANSPTRSMVLADAAAEVGETVVLATTADGVIGPSYVRAAGPAATLLREASGGELWWIDPTGTTQVGVPRTATPIASDFTVEHWSGAKGQFHIATETPSDWMPGRTFTSPTVTTPQTVSLVRHVLEADGANRIEVLSTSSADALTGGPESDRLTAGLRQFIANTFPRLPFLGVTEYAIQAVVGSTVEVVPTSNTALGSMPALAFPSTAYTTAGMTPTVGNTCLVAFVNGDPGRPTLVPRAGDVVLGGVIASISGGAGIVDITYTPSSGGAPSTIAALSVVAGALAVTTGSASIKGAIGVGS